MAAHVQVAMELFGAALYLIVAVFAKAMGSPALVAMGFRSVTWY
jgi:hypothetical protein